MDHKQAEVHPQTLVSAVSSKVGERRKTNSHPTLERAGRRTVIQGWRKQEEELSSKVGESRKKNCHCSPPKPLLKEAWPRASSPHVQVKSFHCAVHDSSLPASKPDSQSQGCCHPGRPPHGNTQRNSAPHLCHRVANRDIAQCKPPSDAQESKRCIEHGACVSPPLQCSAPCLCGHHLLLPCRPEPRSLQLRS